GAPLQAGHQGGNFSTQRCDATVTRLSPAGDTLLFSSYLGGTGEDKLYGVALDRSGNILLAGSTTSTNFPTAANAFGSSRPELFDGTAVRLSPDTSITLIGANPGSITLTARSSDTQPVTSTVALTPTSGSATFTTTSR